MSNPYAPPTVNEFKTGNRFLWRIPGFVFVMLGLIMPVILTMLGGLPIGLGGITGLLILSAGILMVAFSLPGQSDSEKRRRRWLLSMIPVLAILITGGTLLIHTVRLAHQARQAQQEAMYQRDLAQKALEQLKLQQRRHSENPARN
jgi:apolipoprotein N-acyltransferase